jgi:hypothetical protein
MWWFGQEWTGAAWGGWTGLANAGVDASGSAFGAQGAVLSPISALLWNLFEPLVGMGRAAALVGVLQLGGLAALTGLLLRDLGGSRLAALAAGLGVLGLSQTFFGLAEGSVVAVSSLFIPLGILSARRASRATGLETSRDRAWILAAGLCMVGLALENPYLAPVLPLWAGLMLLGAGLSWKRSGERPPGMLPLALALAAGTVGMLLVAGFFGSAASPDYPTRLGEHFVGFLGMDLEVVEQPWARMQPWEWLSPIHASWTLDHTQGEGAIGDGYLGVVVLLLALSALFFSRRLAAPYLVLAGAGMLLSLGSVTGSIALPFALLNAIMDQVARPLTQPSRFLSLTGIGLSIAAGLALDQIRTRWEWRAAAPVMGLLCLDSLCLGGLSLDLPTTAVPHAPCVESLADEAEGMVVVWPEDASRYEGDLGKTWLLQMLHEQPSVHPGIASWELHNGRARDRLRDDLGFTYMAPIGEAMGQAVGAPDVEGMTQMGIDWVVVDLVRDERQSDWGIARFGTPDRECEGYQVHRLGATP